VDVIVFEGWCLGFQPLSTDGLQRRYFHAMESQTVEDAKTLLNHSLADVTFVNHLLATYREHFMGLRYLDCLVSLDTWDLVNVYKMETATSGDASKDEGKLNDGRGSCQVW
jgi:D-glycerate 3-kinase